MTQLLVWMVMAYGITNIVVYGSIFYSTREFFKRWGANPYAPLQPVGEFVSGLISCPMCFSTWFGFFAGIFLFSPVHEILHVSHWCSWFFDGMLSSGAVWAINSIIEWFEQNRPGID